MSRLPPHLDAFRRAIDIWEQTSGLGAKPVAYLGHQTFLEVLQEAREGYADYRHDPKGGRGRWKIIGVPVYRVDADHHCHITDHPNPEIDT